ncbi:hypothetical protein N7537_009327 [Penicillium hordei]|uniref:Uncharacterized protein n=1 Tax=Penicillium hordei TaxID=40994 RepID=A0AAD6GVL8_9EURO|nr:uncharacterized protein N7537_009327 [Penicillium hordei]KAJ5592423.1 hypothetical protein N7537_009327 [Penicillium hordei]
MTNPRLSLRIIAVILAIMPMPLFGALWQNYGWVYYIIIGILGIWSLINSVLIALGWPLHHDAQTAMDCIFKVDPWFFGILGCIREIPSYYQRDEYANGLQWNMADAALSLTRWLSIVLSISFLLYSVPVMCTGDVMLHPSTSIRRREISKAHPSFDNSEARTKEADTESL